MSGAKSPVSEWLRGERRRHGWKVEEVSARLVAMGYQAEVSTVRVWEAGRKPKPETIEALERLFGSSAPNGEPGTTSADVAALVELVRTQTAELKQLWTVMESVAAGLRDVTNAIRSETNETRRGFVTLSAIVGSALGEGLEHMPDASESEDPRLAQQEDQ